MRLAALLVLLLAGGASTGQELSTAVPDTAERSEIGWFVAPLDTVDSERSLPIHEANLATERAWKVGLEWPTRAYDVAMLAVGPVTGRDTTIELDRGDRTATMISIQRGLADDSIGGVRDRVELALQLDGTWRLTAHWRSYFCFRGPGRGAWIEGPCH